MEKVYEIAILYGQKIEALLEELGARGPAKGAGELLDQVKHLIDPEGLRKVRWFLKLRNRVVHGKPRDMPMPTPQELLQAGQAAVAVLEGVKTPPRPQPFRASPKRGILRKISWRVIFLPELLVIFAAAWSDPWLWIALAVLLARFWALFWEDYPQEAAALLFTVGGIELIPLWIGLTEGESLKEAPATLFFAVPGVLSILRAGWLYFSLGRILSSFRRRFRLLLRKENTKRHSPRGPLN